MRLVSQYGVAVTSRCMTARSSSASGGWQPCVSIELIASGVLAALLLLYLLVALLWPERFG